MKTQTRARVFAFTISALIITACGQTGSKDLVRLNFLPSDQVSKNSSKNLMEAMTSMNKVVANLSTGYCIQRTLYAGIQLGGQGSQNFQTYPTNLSTYYDFSGGSADLASWLPSNSQGGSVDITVDHGATVGFGIIGALIGMTTAPTTDVCPVFQSPGSPNQTWSVSGHRDAFTVTGDTQINLGLWILQASAAPAPATGTTATICSGSNAPAEECATKNFFNVKCTSGCSPSTDLVRFDYFQGANRSDNPFQIFSISALTSLGVSLPSLDQMTGTLLDSTGAAVSTIAISQSDWSSGTAKSYTFMVAGAAGPTLTFSGY